MFGAFARTFWGTGMVGTERHNETVSRGARMLRTALGPAIAAYLRDASVVEVMLNPDGRLWIDRLKSGLEDTGARLSSAEYWEAGAFGNAAQGGGTHTWCF